MSTPCEGASEPVERHGPTATPSSMSSDVETLGSVLVDGPERPPPRSRASMLECPTVGRFELGRRIGVGGMGSVYEARDPKLDRRVAIKVLHEHKGKKRRLLEESRAMARLNHPNVVSVYEVDSSEGRVFVVMELVEGITLLRWQRAQPRSWREVLAMYRAFGAGIHAAHAVGLVHCDLKPENVLVGDDGRARVADFGIARLHQDPLGSTVERPRVEGSDLLDATAIHSHIGGTPRYMSPEQFARRSIDHRSDQFSYCVMLWEALYGVPPYSAGSVFELGAKVIRGMRDPAPTKANVPKWLRRICERGLARTPEERWPSFEALLDALGQGLTVNRRRRLGLATTGIVFMGGLGLGAWQLHHARIVTQCEAQGDSITEVWNEQRATRVRDALVATNVDHASSTAETLIPLLDEHGDHWRSARVSACLGHEVEGTWNDARIERSSWCLADRRAEFDVLVAQLEDTNATSVHRVLKLATNPFNPFDCVDGARIDLMEIPPTEDRDEVRRIHRERARAQALYVSGERQLARDVARQALLRAEALGWAPLTNGTKNTLSLVLRGSNAIDEAHALATDAFFDSMALGDPAAALISAQLLLGIEGAYRHQLQPALLWGRHVDVFIDKLDLRQTETEAVLSLQLATAYRNVARHDDAREHYQRTLDTLEQLGGTDNPNYVSALGGLSNLEFDAGDLDRASDLAERYVEHSEALYGAQHPYTGTALINLSTTLSARMKMEEARSVLERAQVIFMNTEGPRSAKVAEILTDLGNISQSLGDETTAVDLQSRSLEIFEEALGPTHTRVGATLNNLGNAQMDAGLLAEAQVSFRRALQILERTMESEYPHVAIVLGNLAHSEAEAGNLDVARSHYERSLAIRERELGPDHPKLVRPLLGLGRLEHQQGRPLEAIDYLERAVALSGSEQVLPIHRAAAILTIAEILWPTERERALEMARDVRREMGQRFPEGQPGFDKANRWFVDHGLPAIPAPS